MHFKKYSYETFALLLFCGCTDGCTDQYIHQETEGYYTKNHYKLISIESLYKAITLLLPDDITKLSKNLADRLPKWNASGKEKSPFELWNGFLTNQIEPNIIEKLKSEYDTTILQDYYRALGELFKMPTKENEKKLIEATKKLQENDKLITAFQACIEKSYNHPDTIYPTKETLEYQAFLSFILEIKNPLSTAQVENVHTNLKQWKIDRLPTGQILWENVQKQYKALLENSKFYRYETNRKAIEESLRLMEQLADDPYRLSYKALLETLPHGIDTLNNILFEIGLEEKHQLKTYLNIVRNSGIKFAYIE